MFDTRDAGVGLWPGERIEDFEAEDQLAYEETCRALADGWTEPDRHVLPDDLDSIPVPYRAVLVSTADPERLNGHDAVRLMQSGARLSSHFEAGKLEAMAEVAFSPPGDADSPVERDGSQLEYVAGEIGAALTLTRRASERELDRAVSLTGRLRRVLQTFSEGRIDLSKVKVFEQFLGHLPQDTVDTVLDRVLDDTEGLTAGQLRARLGKLVLEVDPDGARSSFQEGLTDRKVSVFPNPDLTANYGIYSAHPGKVAAARSHVEKLARHLKTIEGETRTLDELRADISLDLLAGQCLCGNCSRSGGRTNVTIPAHTLIGLSDQPGELDGYGPVIAEIARKTVVENINGTWTFTVTDQGKPVATGTLARRPSQSQKRQVQAAYPTCVFPGCRQPAYNCDLDHRKPHSQGGPTHNHNLGPLCRHHHMTRHHAPWQLDRLENGDHQWTSPLGHTYTRKRGPPD